MRPYFFVIFFCCLLFTVSAQSVHPKNGVFIAYHKDTNLVAEYGNYVNDLKQGRWIKYQNTGSIREIYTYDKGEKNGHYKIFDVYGQPVREGFIENGNYTGIEYIYENGKLIKKRNYLLPWPAEETKQNPNKPEVKKIKESVYNPQTAVLRSEGVLLNDKKDSLWSYYDEKGSLLAIEHYKNGKRSGACKRFHPNNKIAEIVHFEDGYMEGLRFVKSENGDTSEFGNYSADKRDGFFVSRENVAVKDLSTDVKTYLSYGTYSKGMMNGKFVLKYPDGKVAVKEEYVNGRLTGTRTLYYETGTLAYEGVYGNGKINGTEKKYYRSGGLRESTDYLSGIKSGVQTTYFENGKKSEELFYENGKLKSFIQLYENGKIRQKRKYKDGNEISRENFDEKGKKIVGAELRTDPSKKIGNLNFSGKNLHENLPYGDTELGKGIAGSANNLKSFEILSDPKRKITQRECRAKSNFPGVVVSLTLTIDRAGNVKRSEINSGESTTNDDLTLQRVKQCSYALKFEECTTCAEVEVVKLELKSN